MSAFAARRMFFVAFDTPQFARLAAEPRLVVELAHVVSVHCPGTDCKRANLPGFVCAAMQTSRAFGILSQSHHVLPRVNTVSKNTQPGFAYSLVDPDRVTDVCKANSVCQFWPRYCYSGNIATLTQFK